jgi:hypothetical protein
MQNIPRREETVVINRPVLMAVYNLSKILEQIKNDYAYCCEVGNALQGVDVQPKQANAIVSERAKLETLHEMLVRHNPSIQTDSVSVLQREAVVGEKRYEVRLKCDLIAFEAYGVRFNFYYKPRIKVGEWGWGDTVDFDKPGFVNVMGTQVPVFPLGIARTIYLGLGWMDVVEKIDAALSSKVHLLDLVMRISKENDDRLSK